MTCTWTKHPQENARYTLDWTPDNLTGVITASTWLADSADLTFSSAQIQHPSTLVRIGGGESGQEYWIENTVTLDNGEIRAAQVRLLLDLDHV